MLWSGCCRRRNTRTSKYSSACSVAGTLNAGRYGVKLLQPLIWTLPMRQATATVRTRIAKHSETISVYIVRGWFVKTQSVSDTSGTSVSLLMAQHNDIIATRMEMAITTGVNNKHFVCACVRGVQHRHDCSSLVLHCHVPQLAYVIIHKQIACACRTKPNFFILVQLVLKCGAGEVSRRSVGPIVWEMKNCYRHSRNIL